MASAPSGGCRYGGWWCRDSGDQEEAGGPAHGGDGDWRDSYGDDDLDGGVHDSDQDDHVDHDDGWRLKMGGDQ